MRVRLLVAAASLAVLPTLAGAAPVTVLPRNSVWKYFASPAGIGTSWQTTSYNDTTWLTGPAPLGYGESFIATPVPYGPDTNRYRTTYFRKKFTMPIASSAVSTASLAANYDDGFVAYLNGVEVARRSLPTGPITYGQLATSHEGGAYESIAINKVFLVPGVNTLAVEVHQESPTSDDLVWDGEVSYTSDTLITRGPYLQAGTTSGVTVRWRTSLPSDSRVQVGTTLDTLESVFFDATSTTEHVVTVTGLAAGTHYFYDVGSSVARLAGADSAHTFTTHPYAAPAMRAWIIGDSGLGNQLARDVRHAFETWTGTRAPDLWLMLGDNAYNAGTDPEYQAGVFDVYNDLLANTVLWPTRGNHDQLYSGANNDYYDIFTMPTAGQSGGVASLTEAYYSFDWGGVHFICLDSEGTTRTPGSPMLTWLANDLAATRRNWVIAFFHHPPYTKGSHDSDNSTDSGGRMRDMRQYALPILEAGGVDLVLTGHSHSYERSFLLDEHYGISSTLVDSMKVDGGDGRVDGDGAYVKPEGLVAHRGAVYAVAGSSSHTESGTLNHPAMVTSLEVLGSMVIDIDGATLDARFLDDHGAVLDSFRIEKSYTVAAPTTPSLSLRLLSPVPNPSRDGARFAFTLPAAGPARLDLVDVRGRRLATLASGIRPAGRNEIEWNGRDASGRPMPPGVYWAQLEHAGERRVTKVVLVR